MADCTPEEVKECADLLNESITQIKYGDNNENTLTAYFGYTYMENPDINNKYMFDNAVKRAEKMMEENKEKYRTKDSKTEE